MENKRRATALLSSAMIFGLKAGLSIGGALVAVLLAMIGYDAQQVLQNESVTHGIKLSVSIYTAIPSCLASPAWRSTTSAKPPSAPSNTNWACANPLRDTIAKAVWDMSQRAA